jgi:hypothetical protein
VPWVNKEGGSWFKTHYGNALTNALFAHSYCLVLFGDMKFIFISCKDLVLRLNNTDVAVNILAFTFGLKNNHA